MRDMYLEHHEASTADGRYTVTICPRNGGWVVTIRVNETGTLLDNEGSTEQVEPTLQAAKDWAWRKLATCTWDRPRTRYQEEPLSYWLFPCFHEPYR